MNDVTPPIQARATRSLLTLPALVLLALAALLAPAAPATAADVPRDGAVPDTMTDTGDLASELARTTAGEWQDGRSDSDTIIDYVTGSPATGTYAQTGWLSLTDEVPEVGETFYMRTYIGLVSLPYSGRVVALPEVLLPRGVEYADDDGPIYWAFGALESGPEFSDTPLSYSRGAHGGLLVGTPDGKPWTLRQGDVLEVRIPVRALRELKGPATAQPECQSRRDGTAPCPVEEAGDHLQVAWAVTGHGGDKRFVTPYVGLFAQAPAPAASTTTATWTQTTGGYKAAVAVRAADGRGVAGTVQVRDKGRVVATRTLGAAGRTTVKLTGLARGTHRLSVRYTGSSSVTGSTSATTTVTVR